MSTKLQFVDPEVLLRNAIEFIGPKYTGNELWIIVRNLCDVRPIDAKKICTQLGWDPEADAGQRLPLKSALSKDTLISVVKENPYLQVGSVFHLVKEGKKRYHGMHSSMAGTYPVKVPKEFCEIKKEK